VVRALSSPALRDLLFGWLPLVTAIPTAPSFSSSAPTLLPRAWLLAGLGDRPVQSEGAGILPGDQTPLNVALLGLSSPSFAFPSCMPEIRFKFGVRGKRKSSVEVECGRKALSSSLIGSDTERC
jgi:hypothetical protein